MRDTDLNEFTMLLDAVCSLHGKTLVPVAKAMFFRAMSAYDMGVVRGAFDAHVKDPVRGQYVPKPADLIAQILGRASDDGRPGAEEAWAIAITSIDERSTVVWTQEIAEAFHIARPLLQDLGDEVGARMAFKDAYARIVGERRAQSKKVVWQAALGWDVKERESALVEAVRLNRIPLTHVRHMLPAPEETLALEFDDEASREVSEEGIARIKDLLDGMLTTTQKIERAAARRLETERAQLAAQKRAAAQRVAEYERGRA